MTTVKSAESAYLAGRAKFERWKGKFLVKWFAPKYEQSMRMIAVELMRLPRQLQDKLKADNPKGWSEVERMAIKVEKTTEE